MLVRRHVYLEHFKSFQLDELIRSIADHGDDRDYSEHKAEEGPILWLLIRHIEQERLLVHVDSDGAFLRLLTFAWSWTIHTRSICS